MRIFIIALLLFVGFFASGNNIRVKKLALTDTVKAAKTVNIKFDLSWENSWRDDINWDAAWVIAKVKRKDGSWKHIKLNPAGNTIGQPNTQACKIVVNDDKMGAFVYRQGVGAGSIDLKDIKFAWNYGVDSVANIDSAEVRVFATEMVYVPQGSFAFGDCYTPVKYDMMNPNESMNYQINNYGIVPTLFKDFNNADTAKYGTKTPAFALINEKTTLKLSKSSSTAMVGDQVIADGIYINGLKGIGVSDTGTFKYPKFPTGYRAFYCMKYEVSQGQYTDFLNTSKIFKIPGADTLAFLPKPNSPNQPLTRFSIEKQGEFYIVSRPDRAMDYVKGNQIFAFANWSAMRPMTELEFEKACRGPLAPRTYDKANDKVNGMSSQSLISQVKLSGAENGTESPLGVDSTKYLNVTYSATGGISIEGGDGSNGAYRVGLFAINNSSRYSSGASYYGIMGLTDNARDAVVSINNEIGRNFQNINGTGENLKNGTVNFSNWFPNISYININGALMNKNSSISERSNSYYDSGFRLVLTAPQAN